MTGFQLPTRSAESAERVFLRRLGRAKSGSPTEEVLAIMAATRRYFEGERVDFSCVRIDLGTLHELPRQIYAAAREIPWGGTSTYGSLAKAIGAGPDAARDVGQAMARNPVPLIIPCHRVLAAGGKLGGFSAPGGAVAKLRMLELEGIHAAAGRQGSLEL